MKKYKTPRPLLTMLSLSILVGCAGQQPSADMSASAQEQINALEARNVALDKPASELARQESDCGQRIKAVTSCLILPSRTLSL